MGRKYRLKQTLLMAGMQPIILPVGYTVELKGDRYVGEGGWYFHPHGVEDNKYHWEEVVEKEFVWDDYLVIELLSSYAPFADNLYTIPKHIENFKELKSNSIKSGKGTANDVLNTEETFEDFLKRHNIIGMPITGGYYFIYNDVKCFGQVSTLPYTMRLKIRPSCIKDDIGMGAGEAVYKDFHRPKPTANDVLNTEGDNKKFWESVDWKSKPLNTEREWEIVSCSNSSIGVHAFYETNGMNSGCFDRTPPCAIHSVKRLSDNEVFSVKDDTQFGVIKEFRLYNDSGIMEVHFEDGSGTSFQNIRHKSTPSQPQNNKERIRVYLGAYNHGPKYGHVGQYDFICDREIMDSEFIAIEIAISKILNHE